MKSGHRARRLSLSTAIDGASLVYLFLACALIASFFALMPQNTNGFVSSEVRFADASESGLQIMPASCESAPDYPGQCTPVTPPPPSSGFCNLWASADKVMPGGSVTLSWNADQGAGWSFVSAEMFTQSGTWVTISNTVTGSVVVSPPQGPGGLEKYTLTARNHYFSWAPGVTQNAQCDYTVHVVGSCPAGTYQSGNTCVNITVPADPTNLVGSCPAPGSTGSLTWSAVAGATSYDVRIDNQATIWNGSCPFPAAGDYCFNTNTTSFSWGTSAGTQYRDAWVHACNSVGCSPGAHTGVFVCSSCTPTGVLSCSGNNVVNSCGTVQTNCTTTGRTCSAGGCICPAGQTWNGSACVNQCPSGQVWNGSACVASCPATFFCSGNTLMFRNTSCQETASQVCANGCSNGACNSAATPSATLTVTPLLVQKGNTVQVSWTSTNTTGCTVRGNNGDGSQAGNLWNGTSSGARTSSQIQAQTTYTLSCTGASGSSVTQSVTVNVIPDFCEVGATDC